MTSYFTNVATNPEWLSWLDKKDYLNALFGTDDLRERDITLAGWLVKHFAIAHADKVFELIDNHKGCLNPCFLIKICIHLGLNGDEKPLEASVLERWARILLRNHAAITIAFKQNNRSFISNLKKLVKQCANHDAIVWLARRHFLAMSDLYFDEKTYRCSYDNELEQQKNLGEYLAEVWKALKPHLASVARPLLMHIMPRLEDLDVQNEHCIAIAAIEPHRQNDDPFQKLQQVLVDATYDALVELGEDNPRLSDACMVRRLVIHAYTEKADKSADDHLHWLLKHDCLHDCQAHNEVYRAVERSYPDAGDATRQAVVNAILAYRPPDKTDNVQADTDRKKFNWLSWLLKVKPDCAIAKAALKPIRATYPELKPCCVLKNYNVVHSKIKFDSPLTVETLLARPPGEQIDDLLNAKDRLNYKSDDPCFEADYEANQDNHNYNNRSKLLENVTQACKQNPSWAFELADALTKGLLWDCDLWQGLIDGWRQADLDDPADWQRTLQYIGNMLKPQVEAGTQENKQSPETQKQLAVAVVKLLNALVDNKNKKPFARELLLEANDVARDLWRGSWLSRDADQRIIWQLVSFWIQGLDLLKYDKTGVVHDALRPSYYWQRFTEVVQDKKSKGGHGRMRLAHESHVLFHRDETWTREHLVPLFKAEDKDTFNQVWEGFIYNTGIYNTEFLIHNTDFLEALRPAMCDDALKRFHLKSRRKELLKIYSFLIMCYADNKQWREGLPILFRFGSLEDREYFAEAMNDYLGREYIHSEHQWTIWLKDYWQDRLENVPASLNKWEISSMLGWLPHFGKAYPEAVTLACKTLVMKTAACDNFFDGVNQSSHKSDSNPVIDYPDSTARLLIAFCKHCWINYWIDDMKNIASRLQPETSLRKALNEALAEYSS